MIVIDTMILAYGMLPHPTFASEIDRIREKDPYWRAPSLWRSEFRNTLLQYVRSTNPDLPGRTLGIDNAIALMEDAEELMAERVFDARSERVLRLAHQSGCSAYDCEYVALAQHFEVELITYDRPVLNAFPDTAMHPKDFLD